MTMAGSEGIIQHFSCSFCRRETTVVSFYHCVCELMWGEFGRRNSADDTIESINNFSLDLKSLKSHKSSPHDNDHNS